VAPAGRSTFLRVLRSLTGMLLRVATKIGQIAQELSRVNPWWRSSAWSKTDPDLTETRQTGLNYRSGALDDLTSGSLYLLRGPRRVGKTVTVKQAIEDLLSAGTAPTSIVRVAADGWDAKDLRTLLQNVALPLLPVGSRRYWFIDEVSAVTGVWDQQVKWLRDNDPEFRRSTVVLTGSNAAALTEAGGALAGRRGDGARLDRTLLPMGFRTFATIILGTDAPDVPAVPVEDLHCPAASEAYHQALPWLDLLVEVWELYLLYGGFPRAVAAARAGQPIPAAFGEDLFSVVSADVFKASRLPAVTEMALLERLWSTIASPANLSSVAQDIGTSPDIVARHVGYLRDAFLLWRCPQRADAAWLARDRAQDKLYAIDPLIARLPHLRNSARPDIDPTALTEMQIGLALRRRVLTERPGADNDEFLFHVRTPARKEIDFVAEDLGSVAIEGKYIEGGNWRSEAATVTASSWDGILVTRNVLETPQDSSAWAVPAAILGFLLDT